MLLFIGKSKYSEQEWLVLCSALCLCLAWLGLALACSLVEDPKDFDRTKGEEEERDKRSLPWPSKIMQNAINACVCELQLSRVLLMILAKPE